MALQIHNGFRSGELIVIMAKNCVGKSFFDKQSIGSAIRPKSESFTIKFKWQELQYIKINLG